MEKKLEHFAYGLYEENLSCEGEFENHEAAFKEALTECDPEAGDIVYVSKIKKWSPGFTIDDICERLHEMANDECGEAAEDFPRVSKDVMATYRKKFDEFLDEFLSEAGEYERLWTCYDSKSFEVTEEILKTQELILEERK